jgi:hypothetical protein
MAQARRLHVPEAAGARSVRLALGEGREGGVVTRATVDAPGRHRLAGAEKDVAAFGGGIVCQLSQSKIPTRNTVG